MQLATGKHEPAADNFDRALNLCRQAGNPNGEAEVLNNIGDLMLATNHPERALTSHESALGIAVSARNPFEQARAFQGIATCHLRQGRTTKAITTLRKALPIYQQIGSARAALVESMLKQVGPD